MTKQFIKKALSAIALSVCFIALSTAYADDQCQQRYQNASDPQSLQGLAMCEQALAIAQFKADFINQCGPGYIYCSPTVSAGVTVNLPSPGANSALPAVNPTQPLPSTTDDLTKVKSSVFNYLFNN